MERRSVHTGGTALRASGHGGQLESTKTKKAMPVETSFVESRRRKLHAALVDA